ncbi:MAG: DNA repair protein RecN [bacterium]
MFSQTSDCYRSLYDSEDSVLEQLARVVRGLAELQDIDERFAGPHDDLEQAKVIVEETAKFLQHYNANLDFDPQRAEELQNRIASIAGLRKKFGGTLNDVLEFRDKMQKELENFDTLDTEIDSITESLETQKEEFSKLCVTLSEKRKNTARQMAELVPKILSSLGMPSVRFNVSLKYHDDPFGMVRLSGQTYKANADGMDFVEFFISTNKGDDLRPLNQIASGGEISRIMLALKSLLAKKGRIPVLVFDEIDSGVSGRIAQAVGNKLKQLADFHQVVCITHLPQIASMGHHHLTVEKTETTDSVETKIRKLGSAERTEAIAKLLAGKNISEAHLNSARELLADAAAESGS